MSIAGRCVGACWLSLPLLLPGVPAAGQDAVSVDDLQGAVVQASSTNQRTMRREGRQFPDRYETEWKIVFESTETIQMTFSGTSHTPRGIFRTPLETGRAQLTKPGPIGSRGGGHRVWIFDNGVLTFLRTFEVGGMKSEFKFARGNAGLSCAASVEWVREVGAPAIVLRSFVDNAKTEIFDAKQTASKCTVTAAAAANR